MSKKKDYSYRIVANGKKVSEKAIAAALQPLGLQVGELISAPSLQDAVSRLPKEYPDFARQCHRYLDDCDAFPDSWAYIDEATYFFVEEKMRALNGDSVAETSEKIADLLSPHMDLYEAQLLTRDLLIATAEWLGICATTGGVKVNG